MKKSVLIIAVLSISLGLFAQLSPGDRAPEFELKNIDGEMVSLSDAAGDKGAILVFTCNGCPTAKAYEKRIIELDAKYRDKGYPVIAVNPNDPEVAPADSYVKMQQRAKEKGFTFPYLFDEDQDVFPAYGATKTPHTFLLKRDGNKFRVSYIGAIDDDQRSAQVEEKFLENAIAALGSGNSPEPSVTRAVGCGIKFKK